MSLAVVRSAVGVVTSPGNLIKFPPTVKQVQFISDFCGHIVATVLPYETFLPSDTLPLGIKNMVFVPDVILVTNPCASWTILFANKFSQMSLVVPLIRHLYSMYAPLFGSMTTFS